jgi:hypothetical protein
LAQLDFQVVELSPFMYTYEDGDWLVALIISVFGAAAQYLLPSSSTSTCAQLTGHDGHSFCPTANDNGNVFNHI